MTSLATDVTHPLIRFHFPPPALSVAYYSSPVEDAYVYLRAALAAPSGGGFFNAEADVRARDVIEVHWSTGKTEGVNADSAVSTLGLYCLICGVGDADAGTASERGCSATTPEQKWSNETALLTAQRRGLRYTMPEVGDAGTTGACVFALDGGQVTGSSTRENALSQAFVVRNSPRDVRVDYASAARFIYNATYPAGTVFNGEERIDGWDTDSTVVNTTKLSDERRREEHLGSDAALLEAEREKRRKRASIGIITGAVLAAFLFAFVLWKRCPSCRQGREIPNSLSDLERQQGVEQGPRRRDTHEDDEQDVEKPPPAYHEVVTRQERMAVRYEMQRMNAPVPDYTPQVPTTSSYPNGLSGS